MIEQWQESKAPKFKQLLEKMVEFQSLYIQLLQRSQQEWVEHKKQMERNG